MKVNRKTIVNQYINEKKEFPNKLWLKIFWILYNLSLLSALILCVVFKQWILFSFTTAYVFKDRFIYIKNFLAQAKEQINLDEMNQIMERYMNLMEEFISNQQSESVSPFNTTVESSIIKTTVNDKKNTSKSGNHD